MNDDIRLELLNLNKIDCQNVKSIENNISKNSIETSQNINMQLLEFKKEYINDLRLNLTSNVSDKIEPLIKEQLNILFQKTIFHFFLLLEFLMKSKVLK